jgi:membrane carboxypeptidase/penicillin-binding protein PbpC
VAAKTGTTNDYKDAWAIGYTPSLVAGVWVGDSRGQKMKGGADGSKVAAPIWQQFMKKALADTPVESFDAPDPVSTGKPVLDGAKDSQVKVKVDKITGKLATQWTPPEFVEERSYGVPHSILFFVDKDDPRGPIPEHPENDPQFAGWEKVVADWAVKQNMVIAAPPTDPDDVHSPDNIPVISFISPRDGDAIADRHFMPQVSASSRRGVAKVQYYLDNGFLGEAVFSPYSVTLTIPNRYAKGYRILTAKAFDDVGNSSSTSVTINLTAETGPLGIQWSSPYAQQTITSGEFPFTVRFSIDDPGSVESLLVTAKDEQGGTQEVIGSIEHPALPNISMAWRSPPAPGQYELTVEAILTTGDRRTEAIRVTIR